MKHWKKLTKTAQTKCKLTKDPEEMSVDEALKYFSKRESDVSVIHPDDRERYQQSSDDSEEQLEGMDIEFRIITRSGAVRMFIYRVRFC